jgi:hypothetical protein
MPGSGSMVIFTKPWLELLLLLLDTVSSLP